MSHFKKKKHFARICKALSARHRSNTEETLRRLLVEDLIQIKEFLIPSFFFSRYSNSRSWKSFTLEVALKGPVISSDKLY